MAKGVSAALMMSVLLVGGCVGDLPSGGGKLSFAGLTKPAAAPSDVAFEQTAAPDAKQYSEIISELMARRSVLAPASEYGRLARAITAGPSRAAEAELRASRLRASAAEKNWLPTIGPSISLSSLGDFVASLVIDQVLFDNGRKAAERDFARADVEVAAVALSQDVNDRVYAGLALHITAVSATQKAALLGRAESQIADYLRIISKRVAGGLSDPSDRQIAEAALSAVRSKRAAVQADAKTARAELAAMVAGGAGGADAGLPTVTVPASGDGALSILQAQATARRDAASATMQRAGLLPGVSASARVGGGGSGVVLNGGGAGLGLGTGASMKAADAARDAADLRVGEAREDAARVAARSAERITALAAEVADKRELASQ